MDRLKRMSKSCCDLEELILVNFKFSTVGVIPISNYILDVTPRTMSSNWKTLEEKVRGIRRHGFYFRFVKSVNENFTNVSGNLVVLLCNNVA